jgi:hypothetical protein
MASFAVMLTTRPVGPEAILLMSDDRREIEEIAGIMRSHGHYVDVRRVTGSAQGGGVVNVEGREQVSSSNCRQMSASATSQVQDQG